MLEQNCHMLLADAYVSCYIEKQLRGNILHVCQSKDVQVQVMCNPGSMRLHHNDNKAIETTSPF